MHDTQVIRHRKLVDCMIPGFEQIPQDPLHRAQSVLLPILGALFLFAPILNCASGVKIFSQPILSQYSASQC